jgi:GTPase SAR1 family protein
MAETFAYDVFLSHSAKDKPAVRDLAQRLKADGLRVWLDDWVIQPGDLIGSKIEQGLNQSRVLILVMSADAFESEWVTLERHTALFRDPTNAQRRFIPLRLDDAEIKDALKPFAYVDWREKADEQYAKLLTACRPSLVRAEPADEPTPGPPSGHVFDVLRGHRGRIWWVATTPDGRRAVSASHDKRVRVWDLDAGTCLATLQGHTDTVIGVAVTVEGRRAVSGSFDRTVRVWDLDAGTCLATLQGHTDEVNGVALTADGRRAVSGSDDETVRVWDLDAGTCLAALQGHTSSVVGVALTADGRRAVSGSLDGTVRVWELPPFDEKPTQGLEAARYTNAKVLLVGDSGVGKSGLALRLTEDRFEPTISTDAAWASHLKLPHGTDPGDLEREIWLWDFGGQADYRLIHQLFMDETALAVLVFNPQSDNPFEGLGQWDRDLQRAARRSFRKLLVAGRCDRGGLTVSRASVEQFRKERGFACFLETSANTGEGCQELRKAIAENIAWKEIPWTASPRIFKLLKDAILKLREEERVLLRLGELKQQLEMQLPKEVFSPDELRAVVGLLAGPGVVWQLEFGDFVLLQPERINAYAAAVIRSVRAHTDEIGAISEERVLAGDLEYKDMARLPRDGEQIVLRAMHQTFVDHGLCLRERSEAGTLLVFPSYFKRERPKLEGHPAAFVGYQFSGPLEEIYATLVVRLHYTAAFDKDRLWRFAADFKTPEGKRIGLKMTKMGEGAAEITVYLDPAVPDDTKVTFIRYVHDHLKAKDPGLTRTRHYVCPHCQTPVGNRQAVESRLGRGLKDIICANCENRVPLWDLVEQKFASEEFQQRVREMEEQARANIDNESRELILLGHAFAIAGEAGQIFRPTSNNDWGLDGEIEFKDYQGRASGQRVYLQLKSGDSYLSARKKDGTGVFQIKNPRHAEYWQQQAYPVMLVVRTSDGTIRWMDVSAYLKEHSKPGKKPVRQIPFRGEPFTALTLQRMRDRLIPPPR